MVLYVAWTIATWYFEGRIQTLLRPAAIADRLIYAAGVNVLGALAGGVALLQWLDRTHGPVSLQRSGFGSLRRTLLSSTAALALGFTLFLLQRPPIMDVVVLANVFSQVFVVSTAEVVVCWVLVGRALEDLLAFGPRRMATPLAALGSAVLFGAYHFAHSAPFNSPSMMALLTGAGLMTGSFFFISRDAIATILFHNFFGTFGVLRSLLASADVAALERLRVSLLAMAVLTSIMLAGAYWWLRRAHISKVSRP